LDVVHNWPSKLPQNSMDEKLPPFVAHATPLSFKNQKWLWWCLGIKASHLQ
jgi:hypothetical protein